MEEREALSNHPQEICVSVVIPVYQSEKTLANLAQRIIAVLDRANLSHELVFIEDGSPDDSWNILSELQAAYPARVTIIQLMRNFGQHNAVMCGFRHARGKYIVTMDDDLQHPPEEIPKLIDAIESTNSDVVYGRPDQRQHRRGRNLGSLVVMGFYRTVFRTGVYPSSFRIMRREVVEAILPYTLNFTYIDGLLAWNTRRIRETTVDHQPRKVGRSGYSLTKLLVLALNLFTNFSLLPLQVVSTLGLMSACGGFALGGYFLLRAVLSQIAVPGYASTIVAVMVLGGIQLLSLGMIGEYLGRIHLNINRKPQYTVRAIHEVQANTESLAAGIMRPTSTQGRGQHSA